MAYGFRPVRMLDGSPCNGALIACVVASGDGTALFPGDPVILAGSADTATGLPTVVRATAGGGAYTWGVVEGFEIDANIRANGYRIASTRAVVLVRPVFNTLFEVQADDDSATLAVTDVGLNADFIIAAGSTVTRRSGAELDTSTKQTTATLQCRIEGFPVDGQNEIGSANQRVHVSFNLQQQRNTTGI